jgi:DNA-binding transcriptional LysR family regulator
MLSVIEAAYRAHGLTYSPRFQVLQQQTLFSLVEHGMGIALVPETCVPPYRGNYIVAKLSEPTIERQLFIITLKGRRLSPVTQRCADMIEDGLLTETNPS